MEPGPDFVAQLRRWEDAGGVWRVLGRDRDAVTVGLYRCDDGEEADRFVATDPRVGYLVMDLDRDVSEEVKTKIAELDTSISTRILY